MKINKYFVLFASCCLLITDSTTAQKSLNYTDLINRLYDMEYLSIPPQLGEQSGNFSSFDRKSSYDPTTDTYVQWGANGDGSGFIRKEGTDMVVFEKEGPGVIWRFWSALAKQGHIKIYIDHSETPIIDTSFKAFFEEYGNDTPPMNLPSLVMTLSRGRNHWLPIPYNTHCKIILSENWGAYYHITYSTYPGTTLPIYTGRYSKEESFALAEADRFLGNRGYSWKHYSNEKTEELTVTVKAGSSVKIAALHGSNAISHIELESKNLIKQGDNEGLSNNLWLNIQWDNETTPAVHAPVGMFFGAGNDANPYRAMPSGLIGQKFYANWYMPFSNSAVISLTNNGKEDYTVTFATTVVPLKEHTDNQMRFHALWHDGDMYANTTVRSTFKDVVLEDFESNSYKGWIVSGTAFGKEPAAGAFPGQSEFYEYGGNKLANSYLHGDDATGNLTSKSFLINRKFVNFRIGGGAHQGKTAVNLIVDGKIVKSTTGADTEELFWVSWDVTLYTGKKAQIEIVDNEAGGFGHINVDDISLSNTNKTRTDGRGIDWTLINLKGPGRFCGITLHIDNRWEEPARKAEEWWYGKWDKKTIDWWWGEGDEKFFVDGEKFPSTFGTGSEDYIGYAWSAEPPFPLFDSPFASQPNTPINGNGHTVVNRFHIADNIPFQKSFEAAIEKYKNNIWGKKNICVYDVVAYWYQMPNN